MPKKGRRKYVLDTADITKIRALPLSPLERVLFEWLYTNGARASEPGLAKLSDIDLRGGTVQPVHLKGGTDQEPQPMAKSLKRALEAWLPIRKSISVLQGNQVYADYIFPSSSPIACYPCRGTGKIDRKPRNRPVEKAACHHCGGEGTRWGLSRHEVSRIIVPMLLQAGVPRSHAFPHVLRHSAVTHMLDGGVQPPAIQERVGHKALETTFGYMKTTKAAREAVNRVFDEEGDK